MQYRVEFAHERSSPYLQVFFLYDEEGNVHGELNLYPSEDGSWKGGKVFIWSSPLKKLEETRREEPKPEPSILKITERPALSPKKGVFPGRKLSDL